MTQEHYVIGAICENIMRRLRRSRANRVTPNRNERRKNIKTVRRKLLVGAKIRALLKNCSASILDANILNEEQVDVIKDILRRTYSANFDYYPVPKRIHNSIRCYAHKHRAVNGESLLAAILMMPSGSGIDWRNSQIPTPSWEFSLAKIEECMRELEQRTPTPRFTILSSADFITALRNSRIQVADITDNDIPIW